MMHIININITYASLEQGIPNITNVLFSICSDASSDYVVNKSDFQESFGHHSWLTITNLGNSSININELKIDLFETITVGTWQGEIYEGIFYNVEQYYIEKGEFSEEKSAYKTMRLNDFELIYLISLLADSENDTWSITNNCSSFAEKIWNKLSLIKISAGIIKCPLKLYDNILLSGGKKGLIAVSKGCELYYCGKNPKKFKL